VRNFQRSIILVVAVVVGGIGSGSLPPSIAIAQTENTASPAPSPALQGVATATEITVHGKIVAVDKTKKTVTLEGQQGRKVNLKVENPANLAAAKVGDTVVARFYEIASVRKKKPGETIPAASLKEGIVSGTPQGAPGGVAVGAAAIVVSVVSIDQANGTITVKGPDEAVETVKARNRKNLEHVQVGDQLVVTLWRAIVLSIQKEGSN